MVHARLIRGKADYVKRKLPDGTIQDVCLLEHNMDLSTRGCISQVYGAERLEEVVRHKGIYAPENRATLTKVRNRCLYCYAGMSNIGNTHPRTVDEVTEQEFREKQPEVVRIGKLTESAHPIYLPALMQVLALCERYGSKVILTTKALPLGKQSVEELGLPKIITEHVPSGEELAGLLKKTNSVVHFSIGYDRLEPGIVSQGFSSEWRIKQAESYMQAGVNTTLTIVCDVTKSIEDNIKVGSAVRYALESHENTGITIRLLPLRINSNLIAYLVTGKKKNELIAREPRFSDGEIWLPRLELPQEDVTREMGERPWRRRDLTQLDPLFFHPDFQKLVDNGVGVCGRVGDFEYCDKCNLPGYEREKFPGEEVVIVKSGDYDPAEKRKKRVYRERKKQFAAGQQVFRFRNKNN